MQDQNPIPPIPANNEPPKESEPLHHVPPKKTEPPAKPAVPPLKPQDQDWTPINVKSGIFKNKELFTTSRQSFVWHEQKDLKKVLPGGENFGVRKALAEELAKIRGHGITRQETKNAIKNVQKKFGLSDVKARRLRSKFGSYK